MFFAFVCLWSISICSFSFLFYTPISVLIVHLFLDCTLVLFPLSYVHCPAPVLFFLPFQPHHCVPFPPPPPVCDGSFSWRCCSTASVCPACCANPPPLQALGPSTRTKYFYLFIQFHGLPGGKLRLDRG